MRVQALPSLESGSLREGMQMSPPERGSDEAPGSKSLRERLPGWFLRVDSLPSQPPLLTFLLGGIFAGLSIKYRPAGVSDTVFYVGVMAIGAVLFPVSNYLWWQWTKAEVPTRRPLLAAALAAVGGVGLIVVFNALTGP